MKRAEFQVALLRMRVPGAKMDRARRGLEERLREGAWEEPLRGPIEEEPEPDARKVWQEELERRALSGAPETWRRHFEANWPEAKRPWSRRPWRFRR